MRENRPFSYRLLWQSPLAIAAKMGLCHMRGSRDVTRALMVVPGFMTRLIYTELGGFCK